jgi:hypothetical protein
MEWPIPTENQNPWYEAFTALVAAQDGSAFAAREDRQVIMLGGGTVSWTAPTLTWDASIFLTAPIEGFLWSVPAGSVTIEEGQALYATLVRGPTGNTPVVVAVGSQVPSSDQALVLAVRIGTRIYFRTGLSIVSGGSSSGVSPGASDPYAIHTNVSGEIAAIALKATPTTSDLVVIEDAADTNKKKRVTIGTLPGAGAGTYLQFGPYSYTQALVPVEEVIAQFTFDGDLVGTSDLSFAGVMTPAFTLAGWAELRLYDLGPSGGPFGAPRLVAVLQRVASGLMNVSQVLTVVVLAPGANQILNTKRVYELVVIQASALGDTVYVGSVGLEIV